jgi:RNA polymerase sigma-70 factor, ECF subfamily
LSLPSNSVSEPDDRALVERARDNDHHAFEILYRRHIGRVFAVCVRLLKDRDTAEDISQEAFVLAWKNLHKFRGDSAFGSWLYRIATNAALSQLRSQKQFLESLDSDETGDLVPEYRESHDEQLGLETAISMLPDGARAVFVLFSIEGYTHDEISALLGVAVGSSKAQLHRARMLLREILS